MTLLEVGEVSLLLLPGEVAGELVIGLPAEVKGHPEHWQDTRPEQHVPAGAVETPGYVKRLMPGRFRWVAGLGNDELGYILPLSDFRVRCVADRLAGPGACARLHAAGVIEYADGVAGATCKAIADRGEAATSPVAHEAVLASCRYGQAFGEAAGHYEETNSVGWDAAQDMFDAVARLTGRRDTTQVNPEFAGYWHGYPPPGPPAAGPPATR